MLVDHDASQIRIGYDVGRACREPVDGRDGAVWPSSSARTLPLLAKKLGFDPAVMAVSDHHDDCRLFVPSRLFHLRNHDSSYRLKASNAPHGFSVRRFFLCKG